MPAPRTVTIVPPTSRRALSTSKPSSGRIAATGGMRAARSAGMMTAAIVTPTPTTKAQMTVRGSSFNAVSGKPAPVALNTARMPLATSRPPPMPTTVAISDMISASRKIIRRTWRPEAPTARSSASSRSRWPIVMANTLLMRNALTKAVMKAKIRRPVPNGPMKLLTWSLASSINVARSTISVPSGRTSAMRWRTVAASAPSATPTSSASNTPSAPSTDCAVGTSQTAMVAP